MSLYSIRGCQGWRKRWIGFCRRREQRDFWYGEHDRETTASQTSHTTTMSAQAAIKAPFRLGMKEVYLYVQSPVPKILATIKKVLTTMQQAQFHSGPRPDTAHASQLRQIHCAPQHEQARPSRLPLPCLRCPRRQRPLLH